MWEKIPRLRSIVSRGKTFDGLSEKQNLFLFALYYIGALFFIIRPLVDRLELLLLLVIFLSRVTFDIPRSDKRTFQTFSVFFFLY